MKKLFKYNDFTLMVTPLILSTFGIVMIYSASMVTAIMGGYESTFFLYKQLQWFVAGIIGFVFCSFFSYKHYVKLIKWIMLFIFGLLIGVLLFGTVVNNAQSWFSLGFVNIQPSEFAKLGIIMYLAAVYSKKQSYIQKFYSGVLPPLVLTGIVLGLIVLQPDIGTAAIIFFIACSVIFSAGIQWKHLFMLAAIGLLLIVVTVPNMVTDVRLSRFTGAFQPFDHPDSDGYHLIQSYLAIGNGGLTGDGLGNSIQKLGYLTEAHTDFIMAIIAEELGFIGVILVIGLLAIIVLRGIFIARKCDDSFGALLAIGISSMIGIQSCINLGAISGLLPITGVPLPFISYGGSSLLIMLISMGILNNIARKVKQREQQPLGEKSSKQWKRSVSGA